MASSTSKKPAPKKGPFKIAMDDHDESDEDPLFTNQAARPPRGFVSLVEAPKRLTKKQHEKAAKLAAETAQFFYSKYSQTEDRSERAMWSLLASKNALVTKAFKAMFEVSKRESGGGVAGGGAASSSAAAGGNRGGKMSGGGKGGGKSGESGGGVAAGGAASSSAAAPGGNRGEKMSGGKGGGKKGKKGKKGKNVSNIQEIGGTGTTEEESGVGGKKDGEGSNLSGDKEKQEADETPKKDGNPDKHKENEAGGPAVPSDEEEAKSQKDDEPVNPPLERLLDYVKKSQEHPGELYEHVQNVGLLAVRALSGKDPGGTIRFIFDEFCNKNSGHFVLEELTGKAIFAAMLDAHFQQTCSVDILVETFAAYLGLAKFSEERQNIVGHLLEVRGRWFVLTNPRGGSIFTRGRPASLMCLGTRGGREEGGGG